MRETGTAGYSSPFRVGSDFRLGLALRLLRHRVAQFDLDALHDLFHAAAERQTDARAVTGRGESFSVGVTHPFIRLRRRSLFGTARFDASRFEQKGGVNEFDKGIQMSLAVQRKRVNEYMHRLTVAGLGDRRDRMYPMLRQFLDPPKN